MKKILMLLVLVACFVITSCVDESSILGRWESCDYASGLALYNKLNQSDQSDTENDSDIAFSGAIIMQFNPDDKGFYLYPGKGRIDFDYRLEYGSVYILPEVRDSEVSLGYNVNNDALVIDCQFGGTLQKISFKKDEIVFYEVGDPS